MDGKFVFLTLENSVFVVMKGDWRFRAAVSSQGIFLYGI
jgi:hypothetical protein